LFARKNIDLPLAFHLTPPFKINVFLGDRYDLKFDGVMCFKRTLFRVQLHSNVDS